MSNPKKFDDYTRPEQLPLAFAHGSASGRDDLVVSERLRAAVELVEAWPRWPAPLTILSGPEGSGKSHLAAVWRERSGALPIDPVSGSDAVEKAAHGPVLFEDADRRPFDETVLFHVINVVREHNRSLLLTSRMWPASWPVELPDLRSRLKAATVVEMGEPDETLLSQVIVKLFADRQIAVDEKLVAFLVARMERSMGAAQRLVEDIDRLALSRATKITRALAAEVLERNQEASGGSLSQLRLEPAIGDDTKKR